MINSEWIYHVNTTGYFDFYEEPDLFCWHTYSNEEIDRAWNEPLGLAGGAYKINQEDINGIETEFYQINSVSFFILPNGEFVLPSTIRFIYMIVHHEDPLFLEDGVEFRRSGKKISFGLFKSKNDAIAHAEKRTKNIASLYMTDDFIVRNMKILNCIDEQDKLFGMYIPHKNYKTTIHSLEVEDLVLYNTCENRFEEFYNVKIPFMKIPMKMKRHLFGMDIMLSGGLCGTDIYFSKKEAPSLHCVMQKIREKILDEFMLEIMATRDKFGVQEIPEELFDVDEEDILI